MADISSRQLDKITFRQHQREPLRKESLSSSSISDMLITKNGRILLATSEGGINQLLTKDVMASRLDFKHYNRSTGFPADIIHAIVEYDNTLWAVAPDQLLELQHNTTDQPNINTFLMRERPRFASCRPAEIGHGKWVFGTDNGAMLIDLNELKDSPFVPPLVITGISKENSPVDHSTVWNDTIVLSSEERDLTVWFAALDYQDTEPVAVSRTSLHRKMKQMMGTSPMEFLREARIRKAAKLLTTSGKNVSEIAYRCGFSDPKYFSKCFKTTFGQTPTEYKQSMP